MIAYGHMDVKYVHYELDFYIGNTNHIAGSFAKILRDLEIPPTPLSHVLFEKAITTWLYEIMLVGK